MIECKNLTFKYGNKNIFTNFNYAFLDNNITTILGQSGCGKSTLLRLIAGLLKPNSGEVYYNDQLIKGANKNIFMMHQHYTNFPWKTCLENIMFPIQIHKKLTKEEIDEGRQILNLVGLGEYEFSFPSELSGGMNQRLALARVLMAKPKVILMDEPMSALDPNTRREMQDLLLKSHEYLKNTIIMVTHDEDEGKRMGNTILKF